MQVDEAEQRLRDMLLSADLNPDRLDPAPTWQVFKEFATYPVEGAGGDPDDDMLLFEYGIYDWHDGKGSRFNWSFCRQFTLFVDGEYDHMEQLRCELFFEPTSQLEQIGQGGSTFWPASTHSADFVAEVEQLPGYAAVLRATPVESEVRQEHV